MFLVSCGLKKQTEQSYSEKINSNTDLVNMEEKVESVKKELKKVWLTGEKFEKELKQQKANYEKLAKLKWDDRKKFIFENEVLPKLLKNKSITNNFCKTNDINLYAKCINIKKIPLNKVLEKVPSSLQDYFKEKYYYQKYKLRKYLLIKEKTDDKQAIKSKKKLIKELYILHSLNKSSCFKFPEQETRTYCQSLFK